MSRDVSKCRNVELLQVSANVGHLRETVKVLSEAATASVLVIQFCYLLKYKFSVSRLEGRPQRRVK